MPASQALKCNAAKMEAFSSAVLEVATYFAQTTWNESVIADASINSV